MLDINNYAGKPYRSFGKFMKFRLNDISCECSSANCEHNRFGEDCKNLDSLLVGPPVEEYISHSTMCILCWQSAYEEALSNAEKPYVIINGRKVETDKQFLTFFDVVQLEMGRQPFIFDDFDIEYFMITYNGALEPAYTGALFPKKFGKLMSGCLLYCDHIILGEETVIHITQAMKGE